MIARKTTGATAAASSLLVENEKLRKHVDYVAKLPRHVVLVPLPFFAFLASFFSTLFFIMEGCESSSLFSCSSHALQVSTFVNNSFVSCMMILSLWDTRHKETSRPFPFLKREKKFNGSHGDRKVENVSTPARHFASHRDVYMMAATQHTRLIKLYGHLTGKRKGSTLCVIIKVPSVDRPERVSARTQVMFDLYTFVFNL